MVAEESGYRPRRAGPHSSGIRASGGGLAPWKALAPGSPVIHSEWPDNVAFRSEQKQGNLTKAFKEADKIVKQRLVHQRLAPIAIETRGVVARYLAAEKELTVWSSTQIPHMLKSNLAQMLKLPENQMRVIAPEVGEASAASSMSTPRKGCWVTWRSSSTVQ